MTDLDELLTGETEVPTRRTPVGVILAIVVAAGLVLGLLGVAAAVTVVSVSHTEQGLCGNLGVPCTTLSLGRVRDLSEVTLPADAVVTQAHYNRTTAGTSFWAVVRLPDHSADPLASGDFEPYGVADLAPEKHWAADMHSLRYLGRIDGNVVHSAIEGVDADGHHQLFLSFTAGP